MTEQQLTAYHEAGHAVLKVVFGHRFRFVTIRGHRGSAGRVRSGRRGILQRYLLRAPTDRTTVRLQNEIVGLLAGGAAETLAAEASGTDEPTESHLAAIAASSAKDWDLAERIAQHLAPDPEECEALLLWLARRTARLRDLHWPAIDAVARQLLVARRLSWNEVVAIVEGNRPAAA